MPCLLYARTRQLVYPGYPPAIRTSLTVLGHTWRCLGYTATGVKLAVDWSVVIVSCVYNLCIYCLYVNVRSTGGFQ